MLRVLLLVIAAAFASVVPPFTVNDAPEPTVMGPPSVNVPLVSETPAVLVIDRVLRDCVVSVPEFEIVCADEPPRLTVPAVDVAKLSVAPFATEMFLLIAWPG